MKNTAITDSKELEFAVFCIENIALRLQVPPENVYKALTVDSDILNSYIVPEYESLHTQGKDYIIEDILTVMKKRGIHI